MPRAEDSVTSGWRGVLYILNMQVYAVGLLPKEFHTLEVLLPTKFHITQTTAKGFLEDIDRIIGTCACVVINPKKLEDGQLAYLLEKWRDCLRWHVKSPISMGSFALT